ncbi:hypothetical protein EV646_106385 [Kribbella antiqua]|uniref:LPXTG-motif cell wall-anchored protein n=1 Tax=Kribbella antiqua TaxID=2512217 RepID=A0A4R2IWC4_9ACTN|nr:hypothetical protein EV646_106385 [Kribbella antiqua]
MRTKRLLSALLLGVALVLMPAVASATTVADPTPTPTLGSTESPTVNPPGAGDTDPSDYQGATWVVGAIVVVVVLVAAGTVLVVRSRRKDETLNR